MTPLRFTNFKSQRALLQQHKQPHLTGGISPPHEKFKKATYILGRFKTPPILFSEIVSKSNTNTMYWEKQEQDYCGRRAAE